MLKSFLKTTASAIGLTAVVTLLIFNDVIFIIAVVLSAIVLVVMAVKE